MNTADPDSRLCTVCTGAAAPEDARGGDPAGPVPAEKDAPLAAPVRLSLATVALLGVCIAVDVVALFAGAFVHASDDGRAARRAVHLYDTVVEAHAAALVVCGIVFVVWLRAARVNAEVFRPDGHELSRGWVFWGWVVPIANLWYPRRVVLDVWRSSDPRRPDGPGPRPSHGLVNAWWGLWLVGHLSNLSDVADSRSTADYHDAFAGWAVYDLLDIAAATLAIVLVRTLTHMQQVRILQGPGLLVP
ncbi:DUF4328 domain-containing protein [Streptomyces sp. NPDC002004]